MCKARTALVAFAPCVHNARARHLAGKIAQQLETPAGLWQPDGIDAARERLEALEQAEEAAAGLEDEEVDERLWKGSYEQGWRVYIKGKRNDGHYWYVTPKGRRLGSKTEALSLGVQRKQPTSRQASVFGSGLPAAPQLGRPASSDGSTGSWDAHALSQRSARSNAMSSQRAQA